VETEKGGKRRRGSFRQKGRERVKRGRVGGERRLRKKNKEGLLIRSRVSTSLEDIERGSGGGFVL